MFGFFLFWMFSDTERKFTVHLIEKCQQVVKSIIFLYWGKILKILNFEKNFWRHFLPFFWKCFELWEEIPSKLYFTYPEEQFEFFFWNWQLVEIFRAWLERSHTFGPEIQQVSKTTNYVFRGSLTVFSLCWLDFSLFEIFVIFSDFFCISGQKN